MWVRYGLIVFAALTLVAARHLPAVVEVADFVVVEEKVASVLVEVAAYVLVVSTVACVLVVSRAVAAIAWPEDLGLHIQ